MLISRGILTCGLYCRKRLGRDASSAGSGARSAKQLLAKCVIVAGALLGLMLNVVSGNVAGACLDGPIEVHLSGLEPTESRVYYWLISRGGLLPTWQIWFFDLDGSNPTTPVRASAIEDEMGECKIGTPSDEDHVHAVWMKVARRLHSLRALEEFAFSICVKTDSVGVDMAWAGRILCETHLVLETEGRTRILDLEMCCDALIAVRGVYEIPGRPERIVVVSYKGRGLGCKEIDLAVLIPVE